MLLQLALDAPEHLAVLPQVADLVDIVEVGTPLLKRFGTSAIATARELAPHAPVLADTKTVDGGALEADLAFAAGAAFLTVLAATSSATLEAAARVAEQRDGWIVLDTIIGGVAAIPSALPERVAYVAVHSPTDVRLAGAGDDAHIAAVSGLRARGLRVSLAGGIGPASMPSVAAAAPEIVVVGSAITQAANPREVTEWIRQAMVDPGRGWPWEPS